MGSGAEPAQPNYQRQNTFLSQGLNPSLLHYEEHRLYTFRSWSVQAPIPAERLAKAGFFYLGNGLEVVCCFCVGRISDWEFGDIAMQKHASRFPNCKFVKNQSNNIPISKRIDETILPPLNGRTLNPIPPPTALYPLDPDIQMHSNESEFNEQNISGQIEYYANRPSRPYSEEQIIQTSNHPPWLNGGGQRIPTSQVENASLLNQMKLETERLKSFRGVWPLDYINPADLAKAGFFYLQVSDKVQCAFCRGVLTNWERGDQPNIEHVNNFPLCPFLLGRDVGNLSIGQDICGSRIPTTAALHYMPNSGPENGRSQISELGVNLHQGPKHPSQASKDARLRSFLSWPQSGAVTPEDLSDAGFFYIGINDNVKCFYCDGGLCNWEVGDNPWVEHARWFQNCSFVKLNKGGGFIQSSLEKFDNPRHIEAVPVMPVRRNGWPEDISQQQSFENIQAPVNGYQSPINLEQVYNIQSPSTSSDRLTKVNTIDQNVESFMRSNMVQAYLKANSQPPTLVRLAILRKLQMTGTGVHNIDELCDAIYKVKDEQPRIFQIPKTTDEKEKLLEGRSSSPNSSESEGQSSEVSSLEEENRQLREQRMCKICMDQEVGVVFLPCGHLIACVQCAPALKDCALCRTQIKGTIRTFLS